MTKTRTIVRHALISLVFGLLFLLLNLPQVIVIARQGHVAWYPATAPVFALMLCISPWYGLLAGMGAAVCAALFYGQPILSFSGTIGALGYGCLYGGAAYILRGPLAIDPRLQRRRDVVRYVAVTSMAAFCGTFVGVTCLAADGSIPWSEYWISAASWFLGDEIGLLTIAPFFLIYVLPRIWTVGTTQLEIPEIDCQPRASTIRFVSEALAQAASIPLLLWFLFGLRFHDLQLFYLSFVPIVWIAMRRGIRGVVTALLVLNFGIVVGLHFLEPTPNLLPRVSLLMFVVSAVGLISGSAVSEQLRIAQELLEQSTYLTSLIQSSPLGIVVLDRHGRVELTNAAFGKLFLHDPATLVGKHLHEIFPADGGNQPPPLLPQNLIADATQTIARRSRKDGTILDVELHTVPVKSNGVTQGAYTIYKDITRQIQASEAEHRHAEVLSGLVSELESRSQQMTLLNELGNMLECCRTLDEAAAVVVQSVRKLFPEAVTGQLYSFKSSRNLVEGGVTWGPPGASSPSFEPGECWALRRGQPHWSEPGKSQVGCLHLSKSASNPCLCAPMIGHGETLGVLHLEFETACDLGLEQGAEKWRTSQQALAVTVAGQMALSLANLRLRDTLRDQSIRDPLTGLYNRRFLYEALERELTRAKRQQRSLSVVFLDIDHFKTFNDTFGHSAGDYVLRSVSDVFRSFFRSDDVPCRYGGEEFAIILPESTPQDAAIRADSLRHQVKALKLEFDRQLLAAITVSIGIAGFPDHAETCEELLKLADRSLYESKAAGRDRVTVSSPLPKLSTDTNRQSVSPVDRTSE
jgi:diguanylate cyclase (GGDEF)-like protein/PAS domain S-box-containing protein